MHHVRKICDQLKDLKLSWFNRQLAAINRKQVPLCRDHHMKLHHDKFTQQERDAYSKGLRYMVKHDPFASRKVKVFLKKSRKTLLSDGE